MSPLTPEQQNRFLALQKPWCSTETIEELYGLDLLQDSTLLGALRSWGKSLRKPVEVVKPGYMFHRHLLETFFQVRKLLPFKQAAARLGMDVKTLSTVQSAFEAKGFYFVSPLSKQLVSEPQLRDLPQFSPDLSNRIFGNHDDFCRRQHTALELELELEVNALHCATSKAIGETPPQYAYEFDFITLEPVGLQYQVWLDLKKPMNLKPDCCATKTYWENQELLRRYLFAGEEPTIPPALAALRTAKP